MDDRSKRVRKQRIDLNSQEEHNEDDQSGVEEDGDQFSHHTSSEDEVEEQQPKPKRLRKRKVVEATGLVGSLQSNVSTSSLLQEWIDQWTVEKNVAMNEIVTLLLQTAGCHESLEEVDLLNSDEITAFVEDLQIGNLEEDGHLLAPKRKTAKKFKSAFAEFFRKFASLARPILVDEEFSLCEWLGALSSSPFRPLRSTATTAALALLTGLAETIQELRSECANLKEQSQKSSGKLLKQLESSLSSLNKIMIDLYTGIFVHRYRDSDVLIRQDCIKELGVWILKCPDPFLDSQYLRYLGWNLSDKFSQVRHESLTAMTKIFKDQNSVGLRPFIERFKDRIVQMSLNEVDTKTRIEATRVLVAINSLGLLEDSDIEKVLHLMMDPEEKIVKILEPMVYEWSGEFYDKLLAEADEDPETAKNDKMVAIKALAQTLVKFSMNKISREKSFQELILNTRIEEYDMNKSEAIPIKQDFISQTFLVGETKELVQWLNRNYLLEEQTHLEYPALAYCVSQMTEWDALSNFNGMYEYLLQDFSGRNSVFDISGLEETAIVYALVARTMDALSLKTDSEAYVKSTRALIKYLPALLAKYAKEFNGLGLDRLEVLVKLCKKIELNEFVDMRATETFQGLASGLVEMVKTHQRPSVLKAVCDILARFGGLADNEQSLTSLYELVMPMIKDLCLDLVTGLNDKLKDAIESLTSSEVFGEEYLPMVEEIVIDLCRIWALNANYCFALPDNSASNCFDAMNSSLEFALVMLKKLSNGPSDTSSKFVLLGDSIIKYSIESIYWEVGLQSLKLSETATQEEIDSVAEKLKRICDFCEAVVSDPEGSVFQVKLSIITRFNCLVVMSQILLLLTDEKLKNFESITRDLTVAFQKESFLILDKIVRISSFYMPRLRRETGNVGAAAMEDFRDEVFTLYTTLFGLVGQEIIEPRYSYPILALSCIEEDADNYTWQIYESELQDSDKDFLPIPLLGNTLKEFSQSMLLSNLEKFPLYVKELALADIEKEVKLGYVKSGIDGLLYMCENSLHSAIDLYITRFTPNLAHAETLVKLIIDSLKSWPSQCSMATRGTAQVSDTRQNSFLTDAYGILKTSLLKLLQNGMHRLVKRIHEWTLLAEDAEDADMTIQTVDTSTVKKVDLSVWTNVSGVVGTPLNINASWRLWGAVGGAVNKIVHKLDSFAVTEDEDESNQVNSIDECLDQVENYMSTLELSPDKLDEAWAPYYSSLEQLRKGSTTVHKAAAATRRKAPRKGGVKKKSKPAPSSSPKKFASKRSSRRLSKLVPIEEEFLEKENVSVAGMSPVIESQQTPGKESLKRDISLVEEVGEEEEDIEFPPSPIVSAIKRRRN